MVLSSSSSLMIRLATYLLLFTTKLTILFLCDLNIAESCVYFHKIYLHKTLTVPGYFVLARYLAIVSSSAARELLDNIPHDDVIKWKHFPRYWPFVRGIHRSPVKYPHKGQWRGALMFSLICAWINGWVNNGEAGDLRRHRAHYDVNVMLQLYTITLASLIIHFLWLLMVLNCLIPLKSTHHPPSYGHRWIKAVKHHCNFKVVPLVRSQQLIDRWGCMDFKVL